MEKLPSSAIYTPEELLTVFQALTIAPSYLSKRFIMYQLLGWSDDIIAQNVKLRQEEINQERLGDKVGGYR